MLRITYLLLCFVAASLSTVSAISDEERAAFREAMIPSILECSSAHGVSEAELKAAKKAKSVEGIKPCFIGCVMKKIEVLDSKGLFDLEKGLNNVKKFVQSAEDIAKYEQIATKCAKVNDEPVSDGVEGCERAKLVIACAIDNNAEFPL